MTNPPTPDPSNADAEWGWEAHRVAQLRAALRMTPAERLAWLERTNAQMRELLGRARHGDVKRHAEAG
jgi:hypothetical protein